MSVADEIRAHRARCTLPLIRLRMLAHDSVEPPVPRAVMVEIAQATRAVLDEVQAAGRVAVAAAGPSIGHPGGRTFLQVRLDRLAVAADAAVDAARSGDPGEMTRHLRRFDTLTTAIWVVQDAIYSPPPVSAGA
jgi:hypothetical protein